MPTNTDVTLFDLDNTLIPFLGPIRQWAQAWADEARPADPDPVREALLDAALEDTEDPEHGIRKVTESFDLQGRETDATERARKVYWRALTPYPGVRGMLARLARSEVRMGVVTDAPRRRAAVRLSASQLTRFFDVVVTRDDTPHGNGKASPRPFQIALDELDATPEATIMVGDWPAFDVRWPNRMGMRTVLAGWGSGALPDRARCEAEASLEADHPRQVAQVALGERPIEAAPAADRTRQTTLA